MNPDLLDVSIVQTKSSVSMLMVVDDVVRNYSIPVDINPISFSYTDVNTIGCCLIDINNISIISDVELYSISDMPEPPKSQILYISNDDIIDNKITLNHQLNTSTLDCSIFDENGVEISVGFQLIDSNTVVLDMQRVTIPNGINWKVLLEV